MKYQELIILLPCHSLEDFPQHHTGDDAAGLLAGWTSLWHPALIAAAESAPIMHRADAPPDTLANRLIVVPSVGYGDLPADFEERAAKEGACLICNLTDRQAILDRALDQLDGGDAGADPELAADFLALSYGYLQTQVLTRQMRYSSSLDEVHFNGQLIAAAQAATGQDRDQARDKLTACFDLLAEERDHYYAVDAFVLDLTLLAESTLNRELHRELEGPQPLNLLVSGRVLAQLAESQPATFELLGKGLAAGRIGLVGGEEEELSLPLLSCESILGEIRRGLARYEQLLKRRPQVFGRRRFGLTPMLPQILNKLGFRGACHATLDEGRWPEGTQIKTRWEGTDGAAIDALAKSPLDAGNTDTFLSLGTKLGESMDMDHVATLWLAHWPGHASVWYGDMRRCARFGSAMGRFMTMDEYFQETYVPGHQDCFGADQYRSPFLKQACARGDKDPIAATVQYWRCQTLVATCRALEMLCATLSPSFETIPASLQVAADRCLDSPEETSPAKELERQSDERFRQLAEKLPRAEDQAEEEGYLVVNPFSFVRRVAVELPALSGLPEVGRPIYAADEAAGRKQVVVDVPPMGFVWVTPGSASSGGPRNELRLAEDRRATDNLLLLRNEFFEAWINPTTGALQSLKDYDSRSTRLSQQLAYLRHQGRKRHAGDEETAYSVMAADEVEILDDSTVSGAIRTRGRLMDRQGKTLAGYEQVFRLWRGSRVLQLDLELDPQEPTGDDPWKSYYACRFAWADETAEVARSVHQTRRVTGARRLESPHYVEIGSGEARTTVLTGGLPYHRRAGMRMLDSLLIVQGEQQRSFRLGIGVDLAQPLHEAMALMAPPLVLHQTARPPAPTRSGWLFFLDSKAVVVTSWSPLAEEGQLVGFRARLLETLGRPAKTRLHCCRPLQTARQVNFVDEPLGECRVDEGRVEVELAAHEWTELEARW